MKKTIQNILARRGLKLIRVPKNTCKYEVDRSELSSIDSTIRQYLREANDNRLGGFSSIRSYLSDKRIKLFHILYQECKKAKVNFEDKDLADIGAGMSYLLRLIGQEHPTTQLTAYDDFTDVKELACRICPRLNFVNSSLYDIREQHDVIFCTEVLEHMADPRAAVLKMLNQLKGKGTLVLSVPNGRYDNLESGAYREDSQSYWGHIHFWSPESWQLFLREATESLQIEIQSGLLTPFHQYAILKK